MDITIHDPARAAIVRTASTKAAAVEALITGCPGAITEKIVTTSGTVLQTRAVSGLSVDTASSRKLLISYSGAPSIVSAGTPAAAEYWSAGVKRFTVPHTFENTVQATPPGQETRPGAAVLPAAGLPAGTISSGGGGGGGTGFTDADIVLLGRFRVPPFVAGVNMTYSVPAMCMGTEGSSPTLFLVGNKSGSFAYGQPTGVRIAEIAVPATLSMSADWSALPEATGIQATDNALEGHEVEVAVASAMYPDVPGGTPTLHTRANYLTQMWTTGLLKVGSDLLVNEAIYYPGGGLTFEQATHFRRPANLATTGSVSGPYALAGAGKRQTPGAMAHIPASLQTAYGWKPVVTSGCAGLSNNQDLCNGPGFVMFDPADLTGTALATKPAQIGAMYNYPGQTFAEANGGIFPAGESLTGAPGEHNGVFEMPHKLLAGIQVLAARGVAIYVGFRGTTQPWYGYGNTPPSFGVADPSNPTGNAPHGFPYQAYIQVISLNKFKAVIDSAGAIAPYTVTADNQIRLPAPPFMVPDTSGGGTHQAPTQNFFPCGSAHDRTPGAQRLYVSYNGPAGVVGADGRTIIEVYGVAE